MKPFWNALDPNDELSEDPRAWLALKQLLVDAVGVDANEIKILMKQEEN